MMKKTGFLKVSFIASIVAMGMHSDFAAAAAAGIASKDYVDRVTSEINNTVAQKASITDLERKADKATTLAGYGIADAYTKDDVDKKVADVVAGDGMAEVLKDYVKTNDMNAALADKVGTETLNTTLSAYDTTVDAATKYAAKSTEGRVDVVQSMAFSNSESIGDTENLKTTAKTLGGAVNELYDAAAEDRITITRNKEGVEAITASMSDDQFGLTATRELAQKANDAATLAQRDATEVRQMAVVTDLSLGKTSELTTNVKNNLVGAVNEVNTSVKEIQNNLDGANNTALAASNKVGDLTKLDTTAKSDAVSAINEVNTTATTANDTANSAYSYVTTLDNKVGNTTLLGTNDKTNTVAAINEVASSVSSAENAAQSAQTAADNANTKIGTLSDLKLGTHTNLVSAINAVIDGGPAFVPVGEGNVVTNISASGSYNLSNVQIPVGSPTATTYATIWVE